MCKPSSPKAPEPPPKLPEAPSLPDTGMSQSRLFDRQYRRSRNVSNTLLTPQEGFTGGLTAPVMGNRATLLSGLNG